MSWMNKMKDWGGGDLTFLSSDGECLVFVVVADPVLLTGKYKGKEQERIGCPVVTDEGFVLFITGKRTARKLSKFEGMFKSTAFMIIRHGSEGDINATYGVTIVDNEKKTTQLFELAKKEFTQDKLKEALVAAKEVMKG